ncbi:MAG: RagB/SusD family nutrient uptake outer membrane protein, partial [Bacteroidota bacterium]|nr:RagB/SusD family nutrient uptake outer membrane protein [Bacteroidota bacterium]
MKKKPLLILLFTLLFLGFTTGCEKEFLEEQVTNFTNPEQLLINEEGAEIYVIGAYNAVRVLATGYDGWLSMWGTLGADEIVVPNWG